ncbi:MAG: hypothetical protein U0271_09180 [Polyangiaceae bacterium]
MAGTDRLVVQATTQTGQRMPSVLSAFADLLRQSWPCRPALESLAAAQREHEFLEACRKLVAALDAAHAEYPSAAFWWKDESSRFLGFCNRFAVASGIPSQKLFGLTDADPGVVWSRQAALYMKDDREVLAAGKPRFDIVERQDREDGTLWLRTSKVPYIGVGGSGTVGGFDTISAARALELAKNRK